MLVLSLPFQVTFGTTFHANEVKKEAETRVASETSIPVPFCFTFFCKITQ